MVFTNYVEAESVLQTPDADWSRRIVPASDSSVWKLEVKNQIWVVRVGVHDPFLVALCSLELSYLEPVKEISLLGNDLFVVGLVVHLKELWELDHFLFHGESVVKDVEDLDALFMVRAYTSLAKDVQKESFRGVSARLGVEFEIIVSFELFDV